MSSRANPTTFACLSCLQFTRHLPVPLLKHSFAVTNGYVFRKLGVLLWPWRHGKWARSVSSSPRH